MKTLPTLLHYALLASPAVSFLSPTTEATFKRSDSLLRRDVSATKMLATKKPDIDLAQELLCACVVAQSVKSATEDYDYDSPYLAPCKFIDKPEVVIGGIYNDDCCIIAPTEDAIVIAFRGTVSSKYSHGTDWLIDANTLHQPEKWEDFPGKVHSGFYRAVSALWSEKQRSMPKLMLFQRKPNRYIKDVVLDMMKKTGLSKLRITGHSKGGAMASVAAWLAFQDIELGNPDGVYTFASPYVGTEAFRTGYNKEIDQFSYENYYDIVPLVPPPTAEDLEELIALVGRSGLRELPQLLINLINRIFGRLDPGLPPSRADSVIPSEDDAEADGAGVNDLPIFGYVPVGTRFVYDDGTMKEIAENENLKSFADYRDKRWNAVMANLKHRKLDGLLTELGAQHCKECTNCTPMDKSCNAECYGAYMAAVQAYDGAPSLCQQIMSAVPAQEETANV